MNLAQLATRLERLKKDLNAGRDEYMKRLATGSLTSVARATPYDTGRAKFNWQVKLDSPVDTSQFAQNYGGPAGAGASISRGIPVIQGYSGKVNSSIHITNNLVYIARLNQGHSKQAPAGYVQDSVATVLKNVTPASVIRL